MSAPTRGRCRRGAAAPFSLVARSNSSSSTRSRPRKEPVDASLCAMAFQQVEPVRGHAILLEVILAAIVVVFPLPGAAKSSVAPSMACAARACWGSRAIPYRSQKAGKSLMRGRVAPASTTWGVHGASCFARMDKLKKSL